MGVAVAERGASGAWTDSALVGEFLRSLADRDSEFARLEALQRRIQDEITHFRASDRVGRDEIHDRALR